jgi:hypothetical protein
VINSWRGGQTALAATLLGFCLAQRDELVGVLSWISLPPRSSPE